jgi:hypothetical protein
VVDKIINRLNAGIDANNLTYDNDFFYRYTFGNIKIGENDPLGEENWGNNVYIKAVYKTDLAPVIPLTYEIYINGRELKTQQIYENIQHT